MTVTMISKTLVAACAAFALAGCATNRETGTSPDVEVAQLETLPVPTTIPGIAIGPMQSLDITVVNSPLLTGTFLTDESGNLDYPLIGRVPIAGASPAQASRMIADRLRGEYLRDPQVRVQPKDIPSPTISVGGEVKSSGSYPAISSGTLLRAINNAGGLADYAKVDDVLVMRTVSGQRYIGVYNIRAIQRGNYSDPALYPNDIVTVGDSAARKRLNSFLQFFPLLSSSLLLIDRAAQ